MNQFAAPITRKLFTKWQQSLLVPFDDFGKGIKNRKLSGLRIIERRLCGIAKAQSANHNIKIVTGKVRQPKVGQRDFSIGKQARHQVFVIKLDFINIDIKAELATSAQAQNPHRGRSIIEFLEQ